MTDWIENDQSAPLLKSSAVDDTQDVRFTDWRRADRCKRQIIDVIHSFETADELDDYVEAESLMIDALYLFDSVMAQDIANAHEEVRIWLTSSQTGKPRTAESVQQTKGKRMANNPDFKKIVLKDVKLVWPRLDQTYRFNERDQSTEACATTAPQAAWSTGVELAMDDAKKLFAELKAHYKDCQSRNSKLPAMKHVFGMKKDDDNGVTVFTAKKNAMSRDGEPNKKPKVVGLDLKPLDAEDARVWTGTIAHVRALAFPSTNPQNGEGGISLLLDAVQIVKPEYGSDGLEDDFGPAQSADPDFGDEQAQTTTARAAEPAPADVDEELAF